MALTTSLTTLASKATPRNGFGGASAVWPALSSSRITPANPDASAKAPWTRTTVGPGMGFSSGLERWPQRRYVTGPERVGPGVRRPTYKPATGRAANTPSAIRARSPGSCLLHDFPIRGDFTAFRVQVPSDTLNPITCWFRPAGTLPGPAFGCGGAGLAMDVSSGCVLVRCRCGLA